MTTLTRIKNVHYRYVNATFHIWSFKVMNRGQHRSKVSMWSAWIQMSYLGHNNECNLGISYYKPDIDTRTCIYKFYIHVHEANTTYPYMEFQGQPWPHTIHIRTLPRCHRGEDSDLYSWRLDHNCGLYSRSQCFTSIWPCDFDSTRHIFLGLYFLEVNILVKFHED